MIETIGVEGGNGRDQWGHGGQWERPFRSWGAMGETSGVMGAMGETIGVVGKTCGVKGGQWETPVGSRGT